MKQLLSLLTLAVLVATVEAEPLFAPTPYINQGPYYPGPEAFAEPVASHFVGTFDITLP